MFLTLVTQQAIDTVALPEEPSGMRWLAAPGSKGRARLGLAESKDGAWALSAKAGAQLFDEGGNPVQRAVLDDAREAAFTVLDGDAETLIVARPSLRGDRQWRAVGFKGDDSLPIGSAEGCAFFYPSRFVAAEHARIHYADDAFSVVDNGAAAGTFVNGERLVPGERRALSPGDVVEVLGLALCAGHRFLSANAPGPGFAVNATDNFVFFEQPAATPAEEPLAADDEEEPDYFYPAPRFAREVERVALTVDAPPAPEKPDETPVAMKIGPSMVMALAAVFSGSVMFMRMQETGGSMLTAAPMLVMAVSMVAGSVLWPILNKRYQKKKTERSEARRRQMYAAYLDEVRFRLRDAGKLQKEVLEENRVSVAECVRRAAERDPRLMDRTPAHPDFLDVRLGTGTVPLEADVRYPDERFSVEKDDLAEAVYALAREPKEVTDAPVALSLAANPVVGIAGAPACARELLAGLLVQIGCLHSYEDVKLALFVDAEESDEWLWASALPHAFSDDRAAHFFATTLEEAAEVGLALGRVAEERREQAAKGVRPLPHYVVVCASKQLADKSELAVDLARRPAPGFTLVCLAPARKDLPKQCSAIVEADWDAAEVRAASVPGRAQRLAPDAFADAAARELASDALNRVELNVAAAKSSLPDSLGFLEMYEAGNVGQLNVRARWAEGKASETLAARVGVDTQGEPFVLNLHEKFHGPHGLIAGTTGSGKSEFIISWILSMCVEYSPEEAAFVLIDYKGGGLAGAFDNEHVRLPHLAGTITNLDGAAIARSLVSIKSELKRRQALFNRAREVAGGENVDVYRYLELYRAGRVAEPCPHLFVVADEFAELKQQEPEFMDELISAARIGRSLGVHLVLATQKPTGVVNDQIRANSKFKVCLKVADAADSKEMIRRADAAEVTRAGRFFMLVGYNESFSSGQAAWAGGPYEPAEQWAPPADDAVELVAPSGRPLAQARPARAPRAGASGSPELVAVLDCLAEAAADAGLAARRLWLDPLPAAVAVDELRERFPREAAPFELDPLVGLLDDPANQDQRPLTLPLSREGNAVVYGSAGSGTESVVAAALYDLLLDHDASELNAYVMDFGAETLGAFRDAPQVGDVVLAGEDEKVENLMRMLHREMEVRRGKLGNVGGDRAELLKATGEKMPSILVVVEGFERFSELHEGLMPAFIELTRDGVRCGISFLVTAYRGNGIPYRVLPNFKQKVALELSSVDEYLGLFGSMRGIVPPKGHARGLVKEGEDLFVFQGAAVAKSKEMEHEAIRRFCGNLVWEKEGSAAFVPVLPDHVTLNLFEEASESSIPIGFSKENVAPLYFDIGKIPIMLVLGENDEVVAEFVEGLSGIAFPQLGRKAALLDVGATREPGWADVLGQDSLLIVPSLSDVLDAVEGDEANAIKGFFEGNGPSSQPCIIGDALWKLSRYAFEPWYKRLMHYGSGLWIGNGLTSQQALRVGILKTEYRKPVEKDFGYLVAKGAVDLVKLVEASEKEGVDSNGW